MKLSQDNTEVTFVTQPPLPSW